MYYEAELRLLRETFRKCQVQTVITDLTLSLAEHPELGLYTHLSQYTDPSKPFGDYIPPVASETIYRLSDPFNCRYLYFHLPEFSMQTILIIGPFLSTVPTQKQIMEWAEEKDITPMQQKKLASFYNHVPLLQEHSHLFILLDAFAEHLWGHNQYHFQDVNLNPVGNVSPLLLKKTSSNQEDVLWNMKNIEQRYFYENALMEAVSKGQIHKADLLLTSLSSFSMEQRTSDPVTNTKNYCIIMNTLLRKAAEQGGVHPLYLDSTSSDIAIKIEQHSSLEGLQTLMPEMFRTYCRLVRKHATKGYSPPVQKAVIYINDNLSESLSLSILADRLNISSSYLSTLFKKETGQTVTEYINTRRIHQAVHLLETTRLQIQTIAQHCGIMDVQYFSKIFKRSTGLSPKEYRAQMRH